nr:23S rRNA (uracil(1939)-C(5))-methyltransferase RlmD [Oscillospiraceae bacterium]
VYCSYNGRGFLRHVLIRAAGNTDDIMCVIVGAAREFPEKREFTRRLMKRCPGITSLYFSVSSSEKMVTGGCMERLWGKEHLEDIICGKKFAISPGSFAQVNPVQAEVLYELAIKYADIKSTDTVIDAYCGIGTLTALAAERAKYVYGCEINETAVMDGQENLRINGIGNARIVCEDSGRFMEEFRGGGLAADVVILDPARAGCDRRFLANLVQIAPKRIVYVSCNPESQARDVFYLVQRGYKLKKLSPVDMFPWTGHVECVGLLYKV